MKKTSRQKNYKAFTIIEMLIVISLVGIALTMVGRFSFSSITQIQAQIEKEQFTNFFYETVSTVLSSNRIQWKKFSRVSLIASGGKIVAQYSWENSFSQQFFFQQYSLSGWFTVELVPYKLGCSMTDWQSGQYINFSLQYAGQRLPHCFSLDTYSCKLAQVRCF